MIKERWNKRDTKSLTDEIKRRTYSYRIFFACAKESFVYNKHVCYVTSRYGLMGIFFF